MAKMNYMEPIFFTPPRNKLDRALYKDSPSPAPAPTSQTVTNTSIPEYARPYVERMMGKSEALTDINANPYQTYGGSRIAGFSPLQQQAFQNVANQTTAGQLGGATQLAGLSGIGSLGTAGRMAGAGADYARMATNPYATQAYMNPYLSASLAPQLAEIQRQSDITGMGLQGQATAQGAFGGNRAALQQAENQRNALMAKQQAIGQGYNTAFQNAQQAQQFGANLGLQGLQGALSGYGQAGAAAGTLGQLGQTQFGQQQAINTAQQQVGAVQQAQQQQQLDQAYQDFLKQKNYPYQQLAFMSDMLRGLPLSQSAQQQYTAPPSMVSQLGGLGMAGLGIYGAAGGFKAKGGEIKEKKYSGGGKTEMLSEEQLQAIINDPTSNPLKVAAAEEQLMLRRRMENNPQAGRIMSAANTGIASIPTEDLVPEAIGAAGGGIIAFSQGKEVKSKVPIPTNIESYAESEQKGIDADRKALEGFQFAKSQAATEAINKQIQEAQNKEGWNYLRDIGIGTMKGTSPYTLTNVGGGGEYAGTQAEKREASTDALRKLALQQQVEQEKTDYAKRAAMLNVRQQGLTNLMNKELALQQIKATQGATNAQRDYANAIRAQSMIQTAIEKEKANLIQDKSQTFDYTKNPAKLEADATANVMARVQKYQPDLLKMLNYNMNIVNPTQPAPTAPAAASAATTPGTVALPGQNAPVAKPIPLPNIADKTKLASSLVVGQPYATNNGTGVWDGKQFIKVQ